MGIWDFFVSNWHYISACVFFSGFITYKAVFSTDSDIGGNASLLNVIIIGVLLYAIPDFGGVYTISSGVFLVIFLSLKHWGNNKMDADLRSEVKDLRRSLDELWAHHPRSVEWEEEPKGDKPTGGVSQ